MNDQEKHEFERRTNGRTKPNVDFNNMQDRGYGFHSPTRSKFTIECLVH